MNKSMEKLFGKIVVANSEFDSGSRAWPGIIYIYGSEVSDGVKRAMVIRGNRVFKRHSEIRWGLPAVSKALEYRIIKPNNQQCKNFIINAFNAF